MRNRLRQFTLLTLSCTLLGAAAPRSSALAQSASADPPAVVGPETVGDSENSTRAAQSPASGTQSVIVVPAIVGDAEANDTAATMAVASVREALGRATASMVSAKDLRARLRRISRDVEPLLQSELAELDKQRYSAMSAVLRGRYAEADQALAELARRTESARLRVARERKAASQVWLSCMIRARSWWVRERPELARAEAEECARRHAGAPTEEDILRISPEMRTLWSDLSRNAEPATRAAPLRSADGRRCSIYVGGLRRGRTPATIDVTAGIDHALQLVCDEQPSRVHLLRSLERDHRPDTLVIDPSYDAALDTRSEQPLLRYADWPSDSALIEHTRHLLRDADADIAYVLLASVQTPRVLRITAAQAQSADAPTLQLAAQAAATLHRGGDSDPGKDPTALQRAATQHAAPLPTWRRTTAAAAGAATLGLLVGTVATARQSTARGHSYARSPTPGDGGDSRVYTATQGAYFDGRATPIWMAAAGTIGGAATAAFGAPWLQRQRWIGWSGAAIGGALATAGAVELMRGSKCGPPDNVYDWRACVEAQRVRDRGAMLALWSVPMLQLFAQQIWLDVASTRATLRASHDRVQLQVTW